MQLHGIHHITAITANAQANVDFYVLVLGLKFVKKTVNHDLPEVYHLYYADDEGNPGTILTFFEFPDIDVGRAGPGMIHAIAWRVGNKDSLGFWAERLGSFGIESQRGEDSIRFSDPEGLILEIRTNEIQTQGFAATAEEIPDAHLLRGFAGVRAFAHVPQRTSAFLQNAMDFSLESENEFSLGTNAYALDRATSGPGIQGAGTVHHIAWACRPEDHVAWKEKLGEFGAQVTPVIDRLYFRSIYFREPGGVLFEIATIGPGFTIDESVESLGESLILPEQYEHMRADLEAKLAPVVNPRAGARR